MVQTEQFATQFIVQTLEVVTAGSNIELSGHIVQVITAAVPVPVTEQAAQPSGHLFKIVGVTLVSL